MIRLPYAVILFVGLASVIFHHQFGDQFDSILSAIINQFKTMASVQAESGVQRSTGKQTPVYFLSHGGPTFMYEDDPGGDKGAHHKVREIGYEITSKIKPKAVVVFSAHWQGTRDTVYVNTAVKTDLIYDFYGFPNYMYQEKYPNVGSKELAERIIGLFHKKGIKAESVKRGLDHGVWVPFKVAFKPEENPLNVPIIQVSLYDNDDPNMHYDLGAALSELRDDNIIIIGSGMSVHNLREVHKYYDSNAVAPYSKTFDIALRSAVTGFVGNERKQALVDLLSRPDTRRAHPTFDHLLPVHVAAGAAGEDAAEMLYTRQTGSLAWGQYKFAHIS